MSGKVYRVMLYKNIEEVDDKGREVFHTDDSRATNPTRAKAIATNCASDHEGRINNWFYGGPYPESSALIHSDSLEIPTQPDAHFRVFYGDL